MLVHQVMLINYMLTYKKTLLMQKEIVKELDLEYEKEQVQTVIEL